MGAEAASGLWIVNRGAERAVSRAGDAVIDAALIKVHPRQGPDHGSSRPDSATQPRRWSRSPVLDSISGQRGKLDNREVSVQHQLD